MPQAISFGTWLRRKRRALDLSQKNFAVQVGCAEITVRRMEADAYKPSNELALVLFEKLGIPEPERSRWVRFARGLAPYPDHQPISPPARTQKTNLPAPLTSFIGREKEQEEIKSLLSSVRLITIIGTGGMGKTRVSLQVGQELLDDYPDGVWFVPLGPLQSAEAIIPAVAKTVDFSFYREAESTRQQLLDYLRGKHLLLILDGFEHLTGEGAALIAEMLTTAGHLRMLVTSRERLNLQGEQVYQIPGLDTPSGAGMRIWNDPEEQIKAFSALQLFVQRARRVKWNVQLTTDDLVAVTEICRLVDGMPLGIELAATWMEILSPKEIAAEVSRSLDFLRTSLQDVPERQRSMRAVFESAWKLLSQDEQDVFQKLTVFQGSFSREAAQRVTKGSLHILLELVDKSWLQQVADGRFQLHDVLRQYGYEILQSKPNDWQAAKDHHAEYYMIFVEIHGKALRGPGQIEAIHSLNLEFGSNIQVAWNWLVASKRFAHVVEKMLPGLFHFCLVQTKGEELIHLVKYAREAIYESDTQKNMLAHVIFETVELFFSESWALIGSQPRERLINLWKRVDELGLAKEMEFWFFVLLEAYFEGAGFETEYQGLRKIVEQARAKDDSWETGYILLSSVKMLRGVSLEEQEKYLREALEAFQRMGVLYEQGLTLMYLCSIAWDKKAFDESENYVQMARTLFEQTGDQLGVSRALYQLAAIYISRGDFDRAFQAYEEKLQIHQKLGNRRLMGTTLSWQSVYASRFGTLKQAWDARQRSLAFARETDNVSDIAWNNWNLGELYRLMGESEQACRWYQQALPLFESLQDYNGMAYYYRGLGEIALGLKHWEEARSQFQKSLEVLEQEHRYTKAWSLPYSQAGLGSSLVRLEKFPEARQVLQDSLHNAQECGNLDLMLVSLQGIADLYVAIAAFERAVELAAFISTHRLSWNETKSQARAVLGRASGHLSEKVARAARQRGQAMTIDEAITYVLQES